MSDIDAFVETVEPVLAALEQLSERLKAAEAERDRLKAENSEYHDQAIRDYQQINRLKAALRKIEDPTNHHHKPDYVRPEVIARAALADVGGTEETSA